MSKIIAEERQKSPPPEQAHLLDNQHFTPNNINRHKLGVS